MVKENQIPSPDEIFALATALNAPPYEAAKFAAHYKALGWKPVVVDGRRWQDEFEYWLKRHRLCDVRDARKKGPQRRFALQAGPICPACSVVTSDSSGADATLVDSRIYLQITCDNCGADFDITLKLRSTQTYDI